MPDKHYVRYHTEAVRLHRRTIAETARTETMFIEWKKKGGTAAQHQKDWHAKESARGALVLLAGLQFPASIEGFCNWYAKSGLQRKSISIPRS
jgi:hypothetical protein